MSERQWTIRTGALMIALVIATTAVLTLIDVTLFGQETTWQEFAQETAVLATMLVCAIGTLELLDGKHVVLRFAAASLVTVCVTGLLFVAFGVTDSGEFAMKVATKTLAMMLVMVFWLVMKKKVSRGEFKGLSHEDAAFLNELRDELLTQDRVSQADPRFWVVMCKRDIVTPEEWGGVETLCSDGGKYSIHEAVKLAIWRNGWEDEEEKKQLDVHRISIEDGQYVGDLEDVIEFLNEVDEDWNLVPLEEQDVIERDTFFLTLRECQEHIERNAHNLRNPRPYAMTAFRSPQFERLIRILQTSEW